MGARARLAAWLESIWYEGARVPLALGLLEPVYAALLRLRRWGYSAGLRRISHIGVPVAVVGNLTVGGTGKTPLVAALAAELARRAWRPGIVLRGYGGRRQSPMIVGRDTDAAVCGDEAALLARSVDLPVAVGRRRAAAALLLVQRADCDVIVSDDGLQHWGLARDLEIAVVDGRRRFGNGRLLPAGPLREPAARLRAVDFVVANGAAQPGEAAMQVSGSRACSLVRPGRQLPLESLRGQRVHAVAGIGHPARFFDLLRGHGIEVMPHPLPDHHEYDGSELRFDDSRPVLVTEKDAVKCARWADERVWVVPVEARLPAEWYDRVHARLHQVRLQGSSP
ncbi:MAG TPA: tetraacyldisaccharide 4'-kinase [Pseudomonadota bacterium]|nr:tetraacyldisaccharide 4'-kinase [Xanthomonadales bacterium]MBP8177238.1 tetraacyldisaccharide 4'-kinase [Xanthomonadales bacterium]HQX24400.1 tetraacyldisaccharide 4'-kinase [Pseudomonadota bacterium]HQY36670.1 tetraacyldisaccharide 4'-kinase [Pseudomonadota bacterium]HRA37806.1 tetraacyldisaccharide 4'-kinase [Pseudomonadota bacterium]